MESTKATKATGVIERITLDNLAMKAEHAAFIERADVSIGEAVPFFIDGHKTEADVAKIVVRARTLARDTIDP